MSSSTVSVSSGDDDLLTVGVTDPRASLAAHSCWRLVFLCAECISALSKAAHISSDQDLQVLQGVVREQKNDHTVQAGPARRMVIPPCQGVAMDVVTR